MALEGVAPGAALVLYRLEVKGSYFSAGDDDRRFGFLGALPSSRYAFQLEAAEEAAEDGAEPASAVRVEPAEPSGPLDEEQHEAVQAFHAEAVADAGDDRSCGALLAVCLTEDARLDWEAMRDRRAAPAWLRQLWLRVLRLQGLERLSLYAPVGPAPSPLKLEAVADRISPAFEALRLHGRANLRMLTAVALHAQRPLDDAGLLERHLEEVVGVDRCAALLLASGFTDGASMELAPEDKAEAAARLEALLGAYTLELGGDRYSASKCWEWLAKQDELEMAMRCIAGTGRKYLGRTPTYEQFREVMADGVPTLEVYYSEKGTVLYRRPVIGRGMGRGSIGRERVVDVPEATWLEVEYDFVRDTFVSPAFLYKDGKKQALPNKIANWLHGQVMQRLVTLKHNKEPTEHYSGLRETTDGWLEVRYTKKGIFRYRRCSRGNVGIEVGGELDTEEQPLFYSELRKTLLSPRGHLVPNKVVEWLAGKSLVQLVTQSKERRDVCEAVIGHQGNDRVEWSQPPVQGGQVAVYTCFARVVGGGLVYTMMDSSKKKEEELEYSEEAKGWISSKKEGLPPEVLAWMQRAERGTVDERVRQFMEHYAAMPWQVVPPCVSTLSRS